MTPTPSRRSWVTEPGESLVDLASAPTHPFILMTRFAGFLDETGLPANAIVSPDSIAFPLAPHWPDEDPYPSMSGGLLWHPLFWLPLEVSLPSVSKHPVTGELSMEGTDEFGLRVALELEGSGLYDAETGTWLDVLMTFAGLDADDPAVQQRVLAFFAGADDAELAGIDLQPILATADDAASNPNWASDVAAGLAVDHARVRTLMGLVTFGEIIANEGRGLVAPGDDSPAEPKLLAESLAPALAALHLPDLIAIEGGAQVPAEQHFGQTADYLEQHEAAGDADYPVILDGLSRVIDLLTAGLDAELEAIAAKHQEADTDSE
ncbi:hypothetical protein [Pseudoclavibacter sp. VKM Ac-2867]|uniref:hypothetical protein n=1 Tax=Pseudoclavibacter sp. VKM Ac-2867 TaxID=2783829 RepID=UPI00188CC1B7|nr:hypothetical protein [Pseudoclavibacter sp. VKM Ac-2867]MBF4459391.1 hypothetical protein [Pseudoclavibacter sp. VKM Ac-2867]